MSKAKLPALVAFLIVVGLYLMVKSVPAITDPREDFGPRPIPRFVPVLPGDAVGINMHPERYDDATADTHFEKAKELGITQIRVAVEWSAIEPKKGQWNFEPMDRVIRRAKKHDVKVLEVLCYNTLWNETIEGNTKSMPKDLDAWREFVRRMAQRYKGDVTWWEIWNEENAGWLAGPYEQYPHRRWTDYRDLLKIAYQTLKQVNPKNVVLFGGLAHDSDDWWKDLEAYYRVEAPQYCDVIAIHPYPGGANPLANEWYPRYIDEILAVMANHGDGGKPVWITEVGYLTAEAATNLVVTEAQQADYLADLFLVALSRRQIQKVFFYTMWDEESHGLYRRDWSPKPAAARMKRLMNAGMNSLKTVK